MFGCFLLDPFSSVDDGLSLTAVDVNWRHIVQALMVAFVIIMIDEAPDLLLQISR